MKFYKIIKIFALLIIAVSVVALVSFEWQESQKKNDYYETSHESYISGLISKYNSEIQACNTAARQANPEANLEDLKSFVQENCLTPINESRTATLLIKWGEGDELIREAE